MLYSVNSYAARNCSPADVNLLGLLRKGKGTSGGLAYSSRLLRDGLRLLLFGAKQAPELVDCAGGISSHGSRRSGGQAAKFSDVARTAR
jgi:hypothetical protein